MRCPYCGGLNREGVTFCSSCGRDLVPSGQSGQPQPPQRPPTVPPPRSPYPPVQRPATPYPNPPRSPVAPQPVRAPGHNPPSPTPQYTQPPLPLKSSATGTMTSPPPLVTNTPKPSAPPDPPAPFPPRTIEQLQALEVGALPYAVIEESIGSGRKKIVRISYSRAAAWQQVATLLKAFKEQQRQPTDKFDSFIIQGMQTDDSRPYPFTNGQLCFDRRVRLGDRLLNRYQIDTGSGFEGDALRIVLSEESQ